MIIAFINRHYSSMILPRGLGAAFGRIEDDKYGMPIKHTGIMSLFALRESGFLKRGRSLY